MSSNRRIEQALGVYTMMHLVDRPGLIVAMTLPAEDTAKQKAEAVLSPYSHKQKLTVLEGHMFSSAGGKLKVGNDGTWEMPIDAAAREMREETGMLSRDYDLVAIDHQPIVVLQRRLDRWIRFCCLGFAAYVSPRGLQLLLDTTEYQWRQGFVATPDEILASGRALRPFFRATLRQGQELAAPGASHA